MCCVQITPDDDRSAQLADPRCNAKKKLVAFGKICSGLWVPCIDPTNQGSSASGTETRTIAMGRDLPNGLNLGFADNA